MSVDRAEKFALCQNWNLQIHCEIVLHETQKEAEQKQLLSWTECLCFSHIHVEVLNSNVVVLEGVTVGSNYI